MTEFWTSKDTLNLIIAILAGIGISFFTTHIYEKRAFLRKQKNLFKKYGFLQSHKDRFDWQHWDIEGGKIAESPIESYMKLRYQGGRDFSFVWKYKNSDEKGSGLIFWDEIFQGKMSFFETKKNWFDYRNVHYMIVKHQEKQYEAIFVNAEDQNTKYVMLRESATIQ